MRTLILSGAGLSAGSGIPTFRGKNGLYTDAFEGVAPERLLSASMLAARPDLVWNFHDRLRAALKGKQPNAAHRGIARWMRENPGWCFTQNIDALLSRAGCPDVIHLHGEASKVRCLGRAHVHDIAETPFDPAMRCPICNSRMRPHVVLFEERAPEYAKLWAALKKLRRADAFVVVGTSGEVLPVAQMAQKLRSLRILNNLEPNDAIDASRFDLVYYAPAETAWGAIERVLQVWKSRHTLPEGELARRLLRWAVEAEALSAGVPVLPLDAERLAEIAAGRRSQHVQESEDVAALKPGPLLFVAADASVDPVRVTLEAIEDEPEEAVGNGTSRPQTALLRFRMG